MILFIEVNVLLKIDFEVMVLWKYINFKDIIVKNIDRFVYNIYWFNFFVYIRNGN